MKIAITGGTGFVGAHLARKLVQEGYDVAVIARGQDQRNAKILKLNHSQFFAADLSSVEDLTTAFTGCEAIVHCAGINREIKTQTYDRVHVQGTRNVCEAATRAGANKIILISFLRARPNCGSAYHESKWTAEQIVRASGLDYTILKPGVVYGLGDHMLDHLSHALQTFPVFASIGMNERFMRPLAIEDLVAVIEASLKDPRLANKTFGVLGPEEITLREAARRVGESIGKKPLTFGMPVALHYVLAWLAERTMKIPITSVGQVRMLSEGMVEALPPCDSLPADLLPETSFTIKQIQKGLPLSAVLGCSDGSCS
jgi:uncharacterized protein YbjT (DUF2867 family)